MFLTSFREEVLANAEQDQSKIITDELGNLFKVVCNDAQVKWIMQTHIRSIVAKRLSANPLEALLFANELKDAVDIEDFFRTKVDPSKTLRENDVFRMRTTFTERDLLTQLEPIMAL